MKFKSVTEWVRIERVCGESTARKIAKEIGLGEIVAGRRMLSSWEWGKLKKYVNRYVKVRSTNEE